MRVEMDNGRVIISKLRRNTAMKFPVIIIFVVCFIFIDSLNGISIYMYRGITFAETYFVDSVLTTLFTLLNINKIILFNVVYMMRWAGIFISRSFSQL